MRKIITLLLVLVILFSIYTPAVAGPIRFTDSDRMNYDVDMYHEHMWDSFNSLFDFTPYPFLIQSELFAYQGFVRNIESNPILRSLLPFTSWVTDENMTVERSIEILANFILLMEYELNEVHNHMVEADTLNTFSDYAYDLAGIVTSKLGGLADLTFNALDVVVDSANDYRILAMMLLNYETSYNFLSVIIQYAESENLVEGAIVLRNNVNRLMEHKLNYFGDVVQRVGVFTGKDVFVDTILLDLINNQELALSVVDQFALETLAKGYSALNDVWLGLNIARDLGVFIADMLGGISNVHNRVVEMQAMYQINQALISSTEKLRREVHSGSDLDEIERVFQNMRYMMYVNARGDFLLYEMSMNDGHLLSLIFTDRQSIQEWYYIIQRAFNDLIFPLEDFWPERELFRLDSVIQEPENRGISYDWIEWFSIPFGEWFSNQAPERGINGYGIQHPNNENVTFIFVWDFESDPADYPHVIIAPISTWLGNSINTIEGLREIYGENLKIGREQFFTGEDGEFRYQAGVTIGEFYTMFFLENEHDIIDITSTVSFHRRCSFQDNREDLDNLEQNNADNEVPLLPEQSSVQNLLLGTWTERCCCYWITITFRDNGQVDWRETDGSARGPWTIRDDNTLEIELWGAGWNDFVVATWAEGGNPSRREWFITADRLYLDGMIFTRD